jgi:sigma-E factor negative regulatory protein RseA
MNTKEISREQISALADGECGDAQLDVVFAALRKSEGKADWDLYHQIGDVLRSDDMAAPLSAGFEARMAARLNAEPVIIAPASVPVTSADMTPSAKGRNARRWALPGAVAAAVTATLAFVATPQLMVAMKSDSPKAAETRLAVKDMPTAGDGQGAIIAASAPNGTVLRDPRIEEYLLAHQRLSPSVISTAQIARSATYGSDANK